jgi:hypothetical protein
MVAAAVRRSSSPFIERGGDLVEGGDRVALSFVWPGCEQRSQLTFKGCDEGFGCLATFGAQFDRRYASVFAVVAAADGPAFGRTIDEPGNVGLVAAKRLRERSDRGWLQCGAEQLGLLGREAVLAACAKVGVVEGDPQPPRACGTVRGPTGRCWCISAVISATILDLIIGLDDNVIDYI